MMCWFRGGLTDSFGGYDLLDGGLGLIDGLACPHYDGEALRKPAFRKLIAERAMRGYAADDGAALHFAGSQLVEVVSSRPGAAAWSLENVDGQVVETRLPTRYLGVSA